jgi:hypothetical protein
MSHGHKKAKQEFQQAVDDLLGLVGETVGNNARQNDADWRTRATGLVATIFAAEARMSRPAREEMQGLLIEINTTAQEYGLPVPAQG